MRKLFMLPAISLGGGVFSGRYKTTDTPDAVQIIRECVERGITLIDTSPFYGDSEVIIGQALKTLGYGRERYQLATKVGRYGWKKEDFDYSAGRVRDSVLNSCRVLGVEYLDVVYVHDVEFLDASETLDHALPALFQLKEEGVVRMVGISGYPLDVLLDIAVVMQQRKSPLDVVLSYCHYTLQNTLLEEYAPRLKEAGVQHVMNASPLAMGLLGHPPEWHPAPIELKQRIYACSTYCQSQGLDLSTLALQKSLSGVNKLFDSVVVGLGSLEEVETIVKVWKQPVADKEVMRTIEAMLGEWKDWRWDST